MSHLVNTVLFARKRNTVYFLETGLKASAENSSETFQRKIYPASVQFNPVNPVTLVSEFNALEVAAALKDSIIPYLQSNDLVEHVLVAERNDYLKFSFHTAAQATDFNKFLSDLKMPTIALPVSTPRAKSGTKASSVVAKPQRAPAAPAMQAAPATPPATAAKPAAQAPATKK